MTVHFNFGNVINSYVNNIFPHCDDLDKYDDSSCTTQDENHPNDIPWYHKLTISLFSIAIISLLVLLCTITVNIKSVFLTNKSLNYAIDDIFSPNETGFTFFTEKLYKINAEPKSVSENSTNQNNSTIQDVSVSLTHEEHINKINQLKTRTDLALWIQLGLIPSLFQGLNTFNKLVTNIIRISFTGKDQSYSYSVPANVLSSSKVLLHSNSSEKSGDKSQTNTSVTYKYSFDEKKSLNYQYVKGENLDEMMSSLMQGTGYLSEFPFFPLNSIISDESITSVSVDFLTHNVLSDVISFVNISFDLFKTENVINGQNAVDFKIFSKPYVLSYRINTTLFPIILDGILALVLIANVIYSVVLNKMYSSSFFIFDYIFEFIFNVSVFSSLVLFNAVVFFANFYLPRISSSDCDTGFCISKIALGYHDVIFDSERFIKITPDLLKSHIRITVILFGFLCFFTLLSIFSSLISTWLVINKSRKVSLIYKKYYYHLKLPLVSLVLGLSISIIIISVFNSSVSHMFKSSALSIIHNFFALLNLILGISNESTLKYIDNYSIIYSIVFVMLLFISFYLAVILITSLLLIFDDNEKTLDFYKIPPSWMYDNFRLIKFLNSFSTRYNKAMYFIKSKLLRIQIRHNIKPPTFLTDTNPEHEYKPPETKKKFQISFLSCFKIITYLALVGCMCGLIYIELNCIKVSRVISKTIDDLVFKDNHKWNFELKFYNMSYSDLLNGSDLNPKNHKMNAILESTLVNEKIKTYIDLYKWLDGGSIKSLFKWIDNSDEVNSEENNDKIIGINSRYQIYPQNRPLLLYLSFYRRPPTDIVSKMKRILNSDRYYQFLRFDKESYGLGSIMDNIGTIPDTVKNIGIDLVVVDSQSYNKIYNCNINFFIDKSGLMGYDFKVYNVFSLFLPSEKRNLFLYIILGSTCSFLILMIVLMFGHIYKFRKGYLVYYHGSNSFYMLLMYFINDIKRVFDLFVIFLALAIVVMYCLIIIFHKIIIGNFEKMDDIYYRYYFNILSDRILYIHSSVALVLGLVVLFAFILKSLTVRHYLYVTICVVYQMRKMYLNIAFYFFVMLFTFLFFYYFISKQYFKEFIKGNRFLKRCIRLILHDHQYFGDFKNNSLSELLLFPLCLTFKTWLTILIFYHLWSVWPRSEYSKMGKNENDVDIMDQPDWTEQKFKNSDLEVTSLTQEQLDILPKELKTQAAQETVHLFNKFKEYNNSFRQSGKSKLSFIGSLHEELGHEMSDLLDIANKLEFKLGIISNQTNTLQEKSYKDLEEQITLLEQSLNDKREELKNIFELYNEKCKY